MEDSTQNPLLPDNPPSVGAVRLAVQFSCGCDAFVDIPLILFGQIGADSGGKLGPTEVAQFVFGSYGAQLLQELSNAPHGENFCPATFGSSVEPEEKS